MSNARFGPDGEPDLERYHAFGINLLMSGIDATARPKVS